ncbi:exported hypothetical protein [Rhodospirillaceae bacterium LM-1]|nr:exported hypothetical protein [Rhodospirillaceae bacterium LM-1]
MEKQSRFIALFLPLSLLLSGCWGDALPKISDNEIIKAIERSFIPHYISSYNDEGGGVGGVQIEVKEIQIGDIREMQLEWGKLAEPCWPVKAKVKVVINFKANTPQEKLRGGWNPVVPNEGFCFYKDNFKEWTFQTLYL